LATSIGGSRAGRWSYSSLLALVSFLPYFIAWARRPSAALYDWLIPPYPEDGLAYLAWVRQAANGALLFKLKYTALRQHAVIFQPLFLIAGWLCRFFAISPGFSLFLLRIVGIAIFSAALHRLLAQLELSSRARRFSLALVAASSGVGAFVPAAVQSADLTLVDLNTLWSLTWNPLFPWALALLLFIVICASELADSVRDGLLLGGALGLLAFLHPYDLGTAAPLAAAILFARRTSLTPRALISLAIPLVPAIAIQAWLSLSDPLLVQHGAQGAMNSPELISLISGLGIPGLLAAIGAYAVLSDPSREQAWPLVSWAALSLLLCHAPVWFQRKLLFGVHLPNCLLAALAIDWLIERARVQFRSAALAGFVLLVPISAATQAVNARATLAQLSLDSAAYYAPSPLAHALGFLAAQRSPDSVVLAGPNTSRLIPGLSGNTVLYGHWAQAVDASARMAWLAFLFNPKSPITDAQRLAELQRAGVRYLLLDADGRAFLGDLPAWLRAGTSRIFQDGEVEILTL